MSGLGKYLSFVAIALGAALLAGCSTPSAPSVNVDEAMLLVQVGRPVLRCRADCLAAWRAAAPQAEQDLARQRWRDLAESLIRVNYQDDLTLYYLGRAAEGLGYPKAAASYYRQSMEFSGTSGSCAYLSRQCGGVTLPRDAALRLATLDNDLNRARPARRPSPPSASSANPPAAGAEAEPASAVAQPSPEQALPVAPAPAVPPPPPPPDATGSALQFIEPPSR